VFKRIAVGETLDEFVLTPLYAILLPCLEDGSGKRRDSPHGQNSEEAGELHD